MRTALSSFAIALTIALLSSGCAPNNAYYDRLQAGLDHHISEAQIAADDENYDLALFHLERVNQILRTWDASNNAYAAQQATMVDLYNGIQARRTAEEINRQGTYCFHTEHGNLTCW